MPKGIDVSVSPKESSHNYLYGHGPRKETIQGAVRPAMKIDEHSWLKKRQHTGCRDILMWIRDQREILM